MLGQCRVTPGGPCRSCMPPHSSMLHKRHTRERSACMCTACDSDPCCVQALCTGTGQGKDVKAYWPQAHLGMFTRTPWTPSFLGLSCIGDSRMAVSMLATFCGTPQQVSAARGPVMLPAGTASRRRRRSCTAFHKLAKGVCTRGGGTRMTPNAASPTQNAMAHTGETIFSLRPLAQASYFTSKSQQRREHAAFSAAARQRAQAEAPHLGVKRGDDQRLPLAHCDRGQALQRRGLAVRQHAQVVQHACALAPRMLAQLQAWPEGGCNGSASVCQGMFRTLATPAC